MTIDYMKWRELCSEAILEKDVNKLFRLFVELDRGNSDAGTYSNTPKALPDRIRNNIKRYSRKRMSLTS